MSTRSTVGRNTMPGKVLVRITPNHVVAQADIAD
jgi:hypothetical protein